MSVTHIAGAPITVGNRVVQRCAWCGEKLCDSKNVMMPVNPDGSPPTFPTWEAGRLVRVTEGNPSRSTLLADTEALPNDSCVDLVE